MSPEVLQKKKEMIEKDNPALVDALFVYLIRTGKLDVDTLEGFRKVCRRGQFQGDRRSVRAN